MMMTMKYRIRHIHYLLLLLAVLVVSGLGCAGTSGVKKAEVLGPPPEVFDELAYHHYTNGTILMLDHSYTYAVDELEKALSYEPDSREIRLSLGDCYANLGQFDKALTVVSAIEPKRLDAWKRLADYYRKQNRNEETYQAYQQVLRYDTTDADAYWYLAQLEMGKGNAEKAIGYMEKLAALRLSSRTMTELGRMYWRAGKNDQAAKTLGEVVNGVYGPVPREAYGLLSDLLMQIGRPGEAVAVLREARIVHPGQILFLQRLVDALIASGQYEQAAVEMAELVSEQRRPEDIIRLAVLNFQIGHLVESDSLFTIAAAARADDYLPHLYLGRLRSIRGEYDSAKVHFARAVEIDDERPDAYIGWANSLLAQDSTARAIALAKEGEFLAKEKVGLQFMIGVTYSREEKFDSAIVWLEKAHTSEPADLRIRFSLGSAYERSGRFDDAVAMFRTVIAVDSSNAGALNYLGYMWAEKGVKLDTALVLIERAVTLDSNNSAFLDSYAWVLFKLDRIEEAEVQIRKALEHTGKDQQDPVLYEHYGDILARGGQLKQAREQWAKALTLDPENTSIKEKLNTSGP